MHITKGYQKRIAGAARKLWDTRKVQPNELMSNPPLSVSGRHEGKRKQNASLLVIQDAPSLRLASHQPQLQNMGAGVAVTLDAETPELMYQTK